MGTHGDSLLLMTTWVLGGFLTALVVLVSLLGIFILGALLIPLVPIVAIVIIAGSLLRGETTQAAVEQPYTIETRTVEEAEEILKAASREEVATTGNR